MDADRGSLLLVQFARSPQEGRVKTRMMPHLSASEACDLHCQLTLWTCDQLLNCGLGAVELSVAGDTDHALFRQCEAMGIARLTTQYGSDLGERMFNAVAAGFGALTNASFWWAVIVRVLTCHILSRRLRHCRRHPWWWVRPLTVAMY